LYSPVHVILITDLTKEKQELKTAWCRCHFSREATSNEL